jgi:hypothetical protein
MRVVFSLQPAGANPLSKVKDLHVAAFSISIIVALCSLAQNIRQAIIVICLVLFVSVFFRNYAKCYGAPRSLELDESGMRYKDCSRSVDIPFDEVSEIEYETSEGGCSHVIRGKRPDRFTKGRRLFSLETDIAYSQELIIVLNQLIKLDVTSRLELIQTLDQGLFVPLVRNSN